MPPVERVGMLLSFFKYSSVGGVATLAHYLLLILLVEWLGLPPHVSSGVAALFGAGVGYLGNYHFTFQSQRGHLTALPRFLLIAALGALSNVSLVWVGVSVFDLHYLAAQALSTVILLLITYPINQRWAFKS